MTEKTTEEIVADLVLAIKGVTVSHNNSNSAHSALFDTKENASNKTTSWGSTLSDSKYPSEKLVKESIDNVKTEIQIIDDEEDVTTDGIYLKITKTPMGLLISLENQLYNEIELYIPEHEGDLIFDWGDGTSEVAPSSDETISHEYANKNRQYTIQIIGNITSMHSNGIISGDSSVASDCVLQATLPDTITTIRSFTFYEYTELTSITIPNSITIIEESAFENCYDLTSITIPDSVTTIESHAFSECIRLTNVTLGNSITEIRNYAFNHCIALTSINIPNSITTIYEGAFNECYDLTSVTIPSSVTTIQSSVFSECESLVDYQLYWEGNAIITYDSGKMPNNTDTIFTIPNGETSNYVAKGYPSAKLVERSA